jgi:hypothetical protein
MSDRGSGDNYSAGEEVEHPPVEGELLTFDEE